MMRPFRLPSRAARNYARGSTRSAALGAVLGAILSITLGGCGAAPAARYHTLLATESVRPAATAAPFLIDVQPVGIPAQVDRLELVVRQGAGGIAILEGERWVAPLPDEVRAALSADLSRRLGTQDVANLARPARRALLRIKVEIRRFDSVPGQYAMIEADWSLGLADDPPDTRLLCHSRLREPAGTDYAALVSGHQRAIAALAAQIAQAAPAWAASHSAACPEPAAQP